MKFFAPLFVFLTLLCGIKDVHAQLNINIKDKVKTKVEDRVNRGIDQAIDKGLDETEEGIKEGVKGDKQKGTSSSSSPSSSTSSNKGDQGPDEGQSTGSNPSGPASTKSDNPPLQAYSKFDFIPGEKIIAFEDFSQDAIGDFPARWNTNGTAEVVSLSKHPGKWLKMDNLSYVSLIPDDFNNMPENFTLEFDFIYNNWMHEYSYARRFSACFYQADKSSSNMSDYVSGPGFTFTIDGGWGDGKVTISNYTGFREPGEINSSKDLPIFNPDNNGKKFHISIWRQKTRVRVYVDEQKVFDIPRLLEPNQKLNVFKIFVDQSDENRPAFLSNFRLAIGAPDTRSKLVTEGKFSTTGILFDVNSDKIKPESYGVLKEIAAVLQENAGLQVKIIGHTDSDGDAAKNLDLSKRRANSVKEALVNEFKISGGRISTDGKGASEPVAPNNTTEGKAQNRRVEFVKM